jgi:hypothetical protein
MSIINCIVGAGIMVASIAALVYTFVTPAKKLSDRDKQRKKDSRAFLEENDVSRWVVAAGRIGSALFISFGAIVSIVFTEKIL